VLHPLQAAALSACITAAAGLSCTPASAGILFNAASGSNSASASSWVAGAHAGYNWQNGQAVYGFETDLSAMNLKSSMNGGLQYPFPIPPPPGEFANSAASINWYGTFRGRLGAAVGPALFYATGGLAYGEVGLSSNFSTLGLTLHSQATSVRAGWVAGVGMDYLLRPDLVLNLQYQYVDLGTASLSSTTTNFFTLSQTVSTHAQFQAVMAGLSWRFAPSASGTWAGGYAGGQGGGAWGNHANATYFSSLPSIPSDARLKRDITLVGRRADGLGIYSYRYLWSDTVYVGVMAQEVALAYPKAVVRDLLNGFLSVDYGRLGMRMIALPQ